MEHDLKFVYITAPSKDVALELGRVLIESRLAACINILPSMTSLYWWENKVTRSEEAILLAKTSANHVDALMKKVEAHHPYTVPCAMSVSVEDSLPAYANWLRSELAK
jgi:periplasmic divalent cation tolerance protein